MTTTTGKSDSINVENERGIFQMPDCDTAERDSAMTISDIRKAIWVEGSTCRS
jgi:hypothetical protein